MTLKLRRSEAFKLCKASNKGDCFCERTRSGPCEAWKTNLRIAGGDGDRAAEMERHRIEHNRATNQLIRWPEGRL